MNVKPIRKSVRRVRTFLKEVPTGPDPTTIHDLRTSTRRLEAAFHAFGLEGGNGQKGKLLEDLRRIRKEAGKVRDLDVFTEQALGLEAKPEEQACLLIVVEHLGASRAKQAKKLRAAARKVGSRLRHQLKLGWSSLRSVLEPKDGTVASAKHALSQALEMEAELIEFLSAPQLNRSNLHHHRLKIKELRYLLQLQDRPDQRIVVEKLIEAQDAIGAWHDADELLGIAKTLLNHAPQCELLDAMRASSEAKYQYAVQTTMELAQTYMETSRPHVLKSPVEVASVAAVDMRIAV